MTQKILVERVEGGEITSMHIEKWKLISSHTARRTGATNMFLHGITPYRIMMITGHTSEAIFFDYLRISLSENAKYLKSNSFFTGIPVTSHDASISEITIQHFSQTNIFLMSPQSSSSSNIPFATDDNR